MISKEQRSIYNREYAAKNRDRILAKREARRSGPDDARRCSVPGCGGVHEALGYCGRHYMALRRNGDPLKLVQAQHHGKTLTDRFLCYVKQGPICWEWLGAKNLKGYGVLRVGNNNALAHRTSYKLYRQDIPAGMSVLHKCDNPSCVNPKHLFLGTIADNNADMKSKGRHRFTPMKGSKNGVAKLDEQMVIQILMSTDRGVDLADRFGVSQTVISAIRHRRIWRHVQWP